MSIALCSIGMRAVVPIVNCDAYFYRQTANPRYLHVFRMYLAQKALQENGRGLNGSNLCTRTQQNTCKKQVKDVAEILAHASDFFCVLHSVFKGKIRHVNEALRVC